MSNKEAKEADSRHNDMEVIKKQANVKDFWFDENRGLFHCLMKDGTEWTSPTGSVQDEWTRVFGKKRVESSRKDLLQTQQKFTKNDEGKLQWSLLPFAQLESTVKVLMKGAEKYSRDNWKNCDDINRYKDALMRHVTAYIEGKEIDSKAEGGDDLPHLAHAVCNCLFLMYFDEMEDKKYVESE